MDKQPDQIVIYQTPDGETGIDVKVEHETIWLTQNQIVDLFQSSKDAVTDTLSDHYPLKLVLSAKKL